ncbi:MAG: hypothetical protein C4523_20325 [Myxococcales bacterium]|nr:MAG: hypothetical protein C4523_20325 [Myxococcales bacterium]
MHGLRHNCISHLVMKGDLKLAQMIAGHSRIQTTADRYTHLLPDYVQKQVEEVFTLPSCDSTEEENDGNVPATLSPVVTEMRGIRKRNEAPGRRPKSDAAERKTRQKL